LIADKLSSEPRQNSSARYALKTGKDDILNFFGL